MRILAMCLIGLLLTAVAFAGRSEAGGESAEAILFNGKGDRIGHAVFSQLPQGVRIRILVWDLPPGIHGMHIYTAGGCHGPEFTCPGAHFNPFGRKHGAENDDGPHAGDLPNVEVREDGIAEAEVIALLLTLRRGKNSLLPSGKTCLVIHDRPDDEQTDPTGNAGARIACGIILKQ